MSKNRKALIAGFMPPLAMIIILLFEFLLKGSLKDSGIYLVGAAGIIPFLLPFFVLFLLDKNEKKEKKPKGSPLTFLPFTINMAIAGSMGAVVLNALFSKIFSLPMAPTVNYSVEIEGILASIVIVVLLPSFFEELLFRKGVFSAFMPYGTVSAVVISALFFALIHKSVENFVGPLFAGIIYGYLVAVTGRLWPAILAHMINNGWHLFSSYFASAFEELGIYPYFVLISTVIFGLFLYFSMVSFEKLVKKSNAVRFKTGGIKGLVSAFAFTPGLWLMILMYIFINLYS